jgi:hypothetical protein
MIDESGRPVADISYAPWFDNAEKLKRYGLDREFPYSDKARFVRFIKG